MQIQTSPLILTFGVSDPIGATGIQADLACFSALGCHGLSVMTGILISDTARVEDVQEVDADWVCDQARVVLEDMTVAAFKVGALTSVEQASAIAEIVSDYPDVPLILDPFLSSLPDSGLADDDMLIAIRQILVPQATVLLLTQVELARMAETWRDGGGDMLKEDVAELTNMGCAYVLVKCTATSGNGAGAQLANTLFDENGVVGTFNWQHLPGPFVGAGSTLSGALAALMARGIGDDAVDAIQAAQEFTVGALANAQRFGMGKLVPNKFFAHPIASSSKP
ncbi:bifunctional hydroxymethylpyrimidine kinase/phosphomethylpyrimidine kinase [Massilia pseudoviolaceinigra]|uniref:bifunctional hydroxymethylpyrimidine kinase/phosphomethylpyrimidine kinase n=1 Tax=Massilia pseudoviolaceinigra TaxID=3057165 RepID=UPI002796AD78|nr:hydroxymethylpyrimidine/phosphomethylpyrimidine kinase [Massilia sp. CCM 9206]MDQ1919855.1 hydroxymethylpyrimidine/phosphomethylpyrimidine kinase [Massilia sp. CCM 9206]